MRVGLNATAFDARPSGAKQRFIGIYGALVQRLPQVEFIVYEPADLRIARNFAEAANVTAVRTPLLSAKRMRRAAAGLDFWRQRLLADRVDLFETFNLPVPIRLPCPTILTTHDVRSARIDQPSPRRQVAKWLHRSAFRRALAVITVSDAMRAELLGLYPGAKVVSIYNGVDAARFSHPAPTDRDLPREYLLAVGHLEQRKNIPRLIEALALLRRTRPHLELVIVGRDGGGLAAVRAEIARHSLGAVVHIFDGVADDELPAIYAACALFVFPSTYEGFGIPVVEAMAAGRPMVLSNIPAFREITFGRVPTFDPLDVEDMAHRIDSVLSNPERQAELIEAGRVRARDFAFDRLASEIEKLYRQLGLLQSRGASSEDIWSA